MIERKSCWRAGSGGDRIGFRFGSGDGCAWVLRKETDAYVT